MTQLTEQQVMSIFNDTRTIKEIVKDYEISEQNVSSIKMGKTWGWLTGKKYIKQPIRSMKERLQKYDIEPEKGCWIWKGSKSKNGYGQIKVNKTTKEVHRVSYQEYKGKIPTGMIVRHICDVKHCLNPDHLILGTHKQNMKDMTDRNRQAKGEKAGNSKITEKLVISIFKDKRKNVEIARYYGVNRHTVSDIKRGKSWAWLTKDIVV